MKSNVIIRKASKRDTRAIARIYVTAAREAVEREPEHFRVPTMDEASRLFMPQDSPDAAVLVAEVDGRLRVWATGKVDERRERWHRQRFNPTLEPLLELDFDRVLVTHGHPVLVDGRAELRAALAAPPWYRRPV